MPMWSILLRVLLCLGLALNGVSPAHAWQHDAHAGSGSGAGVATLAPESGTAGKACHRAPAVDPGVPVADQAGDEGQPVAPDCCQDACDCACMQHATPATAEAALPARLEHGGAMRGEVMAYLPPATVRLIRPPIA